MASRRCDEWDSDSRAGAAPPGPSWSGEDLELERIWFAAQDVEWRSLALVPASDDVSVLRLASAFSALGFRDRGESIGIADLRDVPFPNLRGPIEVIRWHIRRGERVLLVVRPCFTSAATLPLVRAADSAILCVALGATRIAEANDTVEQIGREPFIGTVLVRPDAAATNDWTAKVYRRLAAVVSAALPASWAEADP